MVSLNSRVRESLIDFTKVLRGLAKESASLTSTNNDDRRILKDQVKLLTSSVESLLKIIETHEAYVLWISDVWQSMRSEDQAKLNVSEPFNPLGLVDLSSALMAAFHLGGFVLENPITKRMEKEVRNARAAHARNARTMKSQERTDAIRKLEKQVREKHPKWSRRRVALEITALLKSSGHNLKPNTVEKRLSQTQAKRTTEQSSI